MRWEFEWVHWNPRTVSYVWTQPNGGDHEIEAYGNDRLYDDLWRIVLVPPRMMSAQHLHAALRGLGDQVEDTVVHEIMQVMHSIVLRDLGAHSLLIPTI